MTKNKMNKRIFEIQAIVCNSLNYNEDNVLYLISLINESEIIAKSITDDSRISKLLNDLKQTKEKQVAPMIKKGISHEERIRCYKDVIANFRCDLNMYCFNNG